MEARLGVLGGEDLRKQCKNGLRETENGLGHKLIEGLALPN